MLFRSGPLISAADLGLELGTAPTEVLNLRQVRDEVERNTVVKVLARVDGNIAEAASLLGVSRPTLYDLMNRHALRQPVMARAHEES